MFRLLLFMNEMAELNTIISSKKFEGRVRIVKIISTICSFIYYLTDNIVYLANLDFLPSTVPGFPKMKWKQIKNFFSLIKTFLEIISAISQNYLKQEKEKGLVKKLD